ncbi:2-dehydropantoate 2-reductase [Vagococcus fluvialis]|jgi:2-dehydropantoate 2-reductase|uniref:2-dehydropantoate 2-reductase n=1 Tax=Vagococcus fluvialis TaxID=2738 RepID=UPI00143300B7|nr:2-dehydropantoate 2-reductase [Vagococcus fluvialis]MBO0486236.1 2-dehydropantoate 2-reductase [Vagococcus fluvialis]MDR2277330.1 2-dehydropantoate 2-reductase [Vagococcus sp.]NKC60922.1 2-dehydropantoate 2-reductase [Vagococcus fluvialis]NKD51840.1 2-dehydropantoate 2-reductase [Vagococcus fluvialis]
MKIIIAGAGAMGSRFGLMLHQAKNDVILIDGWQEHIDLIKQNGLKANFNGEEIVENISIYHQNDVSSVDFSADLVILFTKAMQLDGMMQSINNMVGENTKVLCLLNGIGHEDVIKKYVPLSNIILGNTMWTAGLEGPGKAKLFGNGSIDLQNLGTDGKEAAEEVIEVLNAANLNAKYSDNILSSIYKKACVNGTMNGLCTILDSNMAGFGETDVADDIVEAIVSEFAAVAERENATLNVPEVLAQIKTCYNRETIGLHHPSMYQDLIINNRLTEIDYINGAIVRKGKEYGIETPYCSFLTQLVHAKEQILGAK